MAGLEEISWIGCGRVGRTLAHALKTAGYRIGVVLCKHPENAQTAVRFIGAGTPGKQVSSAVTSGPIHFLTTNDDALSGVVREIAEGQNDGSLKGHYFFHTSGFLSSTILEPLREKGAEIGSIHPLQVFADPEKALETLPGVYYAIEGTDRAMELSVQLVDRLQGKLLLIPEGRKVLYHIAGVFAANYLTVLVEYALSIMEDLGETPEDAYQAFLPLMVGALENIEAFGTAQALTGPIARGDVQTIQGHLEALKEFRAEVLHAYQVLGQEAVQLAIRSGKLSPERAKSLSKILQKKS